MDGNLLPTQNGLEQCANSDANHQDVLGSLRAAAEIKSIFSFPLFNFKTKLGLVGLHEKPDSILIYLLPCTRALSIRLVNQKHQFQC